MSIFKNLFRKENILIVYLEFIYKNIADYNKKDLKKLILLLGDDSLTFHSMKVIEVNKDDNTVIIRLKCVKDDAFFDDQYYYNNLLKSYHLRSACDINKIDISVYKPMPTNVSSYYPVRQSGYEYARPSYSVYFTKLEIVECVVNIKADSEEEAERKLYSGDYDGYIDYLDTISSCIEEITSIE